MTQHHARLCKWMKISRKDEMIATTLNRNLKRNTNEPKRKKKVTLFILRREISRLIFLRIAPRRRERKIKFENLLGPMIGAISHFFPLRHLAVHTTRDFRGSWVWWTRKNWDYRFITSKRKRFRGFYPFKARQNVQSYDKTKTSNLR